MSEKRVLNASCLASDRQADVRFKGANRPQMEPARAQNAHAHQGAPGAETTQTGGPAVQVTVTSWRDRC